MKKTMKNPTYENVRAVLRKSEMGRSLGFKDPRGWRGRARALDESTAADVDLKSVAMGGQGKNSLYKIKVQIGSTILNESPAEDPYIDVLARGAYFAAGDDGMCGIKFPGMLKYFLDLHYFESNPVRLQSVQVQGTDAQVIADCELAVVRRTPWGMNVDDRIGLGAWLKTESNQTNIVTVPIDCELDGSTFLRLYHPTYAGGDKELALNLAINAIAERRKALLEG